MFERNAMPRSPRLAQVSKRRCRRRVHLLVTRAEASQRAAESSQVGDSEAMVVAPPQAYKWAVTDAWRIRNAVILGRRRRCCGRSVV